MFIHPYVDKHPPLLHTHALARVMDGRGEHKSIYKRMYIQIYLNFGEPVEQQHRFGDAGKTMNIQNMQLPAGLHCCWHEKAWTPS